MLYVNRLQSAFLSTSLWTHVLPASTKPKLEPAHALKESEIRPMTCLQHIWELILGEETIALTMYSYHWFPRAGYGEIYASDQHSQSRVSNSCKHPYIIIITQTNKSAARVTRLINPTLIAVGLQKKKKTPFFGHNTKSLRGANRAASVPDSRVD